MALWKDGEPWEFQIDEAIRRDEINEEYEITDPVMENLVLYFDFDRQDAKTTAVNIVDFMKIIRVNVGTDNKLMLAIGKAMKKLNVAKRKDRTTPGKAPTFYDGVALNEAGEQRVIDNAEWDQRKLFEQPSKEAEE